MMHIAVFETTHHLHNRLHFANVVEKLVTETFARARAFDQSRDVDKLDGCRRDFF